MVIFAYMILVTGGTGLVGAHLLLQLAGEGKKVRALYRSSNTLEKTKNLFIHFGKLPAFENIEWVKGDIIDISSLEEAFKGVTQVYHCAAHISFDPADEDILRKVNIEGTANMVNCALDFGVQKFCHVSSVAALGDLKEGETITDEETEWNPEINHGDYALTKYGAEMEVWRGWQEGLKVAIVNPGLIFGYGFWSQGSGEVFNAVHKGQPFYSNGNCGAVSAHDVAAVMVKLMESDISGERFILIGQNISFREMLDAIADGMHKKRPFIHATPLMTSFAWRADWLLSKLLRRKRRFTKSMAKSSHKSFIFSNSKIINTLGYEFAEMKDYIKKTAEGYPKL